MLTLTYCPTTCPYHPAGRPHFWSPSIHEFVQSLEISGNSDFAGKANGHSIRISSCFLNDCWMYFVVEFMMNFASFFFIWCFSHTSHIYISRSRSLCSLCPGPWRYVQQIQASHRIVAQGSCVELHSMRSGSSSTLISLLSSQHHPTKVFLLICVETLQRPWDGI